MITPLSHVLAQPDTGKVHGRKAPVGSNFFGNQLATVLKAPGATTAKPTVAASPAASPTAITPSPSQNIVAAALFSLAPTPTPTVTALPVTPPATTTAPAASLTPTQSAMNILASALQAAGISPQWLNMSAHDDYVTYPGGGYTNHQISLTANGHDTNIDANLMMMNPNVAVTEIKRLFTIA